MNYKEYSPATLAKAARCCVTDCCELCPLTDTDDNCGANMDPLIRKIGETILKGAYDDNITAQMIITKSICQMYLENNIDF